MPAAPKTRARSAAAAPVAGATRKKVSKPAARPVAVAPSAKLAKTAKLANAAKPAKAGPAAPEKVGKPMKPTQAAKPAKADKAAKPVKPREALVRDSFTMPKADFDLIGLLKERALGARRPAKKSELLRAGLQLLATLDATALAAALERLVPLKPGRPKKGH